MKSKKMVRDPGRERRVRRRVATDFYAIELEGNARYLRRVSNVSDDGLLLENPLGDRQPGRTMDLVLPTKGKAGGRLAVRVQAQVVNVRPDGQIGLRVTSQPLPVDVLGGRVPL